MAKNDSLSAIQICEAARKNKFAPIYILMGEESYYIDLICDTILDTALTEEEKDFNLSVFYGLDADVRTVIATCKRFPIGSERQVVVVKEAQLMGEIDMLQHYVSHFLPSTVLVICNKNGNIKAPETIKLAKASADVVVFESKKINENGVVPLIKEYVTAKNLRIDQKSTSMLKDFIGTDVARLFGEVDKLSIILPKNAEITAEIIEKHIGISKDYNNFELENAIRTRNIEKAYSIVNYFANNPKSNPTVVTTAVIFSFFSNLMLIHMSKDKSEAGLMKQIETKSQYRVRIFMEACRIYSPSSCFACIGYIRDFDRKSKGITSRQNEYELLRELIFKIIRS